MLPNELLDQMERGFKKASELAKETGESVDNMLFNLAPEGEEKAQSISDLNTKGETMPFVCSPTKYPTSVPGSHRVHCDGCRQEVWMSPGTKIVFDQIKNKLIICIDCMVKQMEIGEKPLA